MLLCSLCYLLRVVPYSSVFMSSAWVLDPASVLLVGASPALWLLSDYVLNSCVLNNSVMLLLFSTSNYFSLFCAPKGLPACMTLLLLPSTRFQPSGSGVAPLLRGACEALPLPVRWYDCDNGGVWIWGEVG
jgi:hypothetical protein